MESENLLQMKSIGVENENNMENEQFFTVSIQKLIIMVVFTMGLYYVYWFYKNYKIIKKNTQSKIWPVVRAIFHIVYTHDLFKSINATIIEKEIESDFNGQKEASIFVGLIILQSLINRFIYNRPEYMVLGTIVSTSLFFATLIPICKAQKLINKINKDPDGSSNANITFINIIFILLGSFYWILMFIGLYAELKSVFKF